MIEDLKNILVGLWCIGLGCSVIIIVIGIGHLTIDYPVIMVPILVMIVAWAIGMVLRS